MTSASEVFSRGTQAAIFPGGAGGRWGIFCSWPLQWFFGRTTFFSLARAASGARTHTQVTCQEWQSYRPACSAVHIRVGEIDHRLPEQQGFPSAALLHLFPQIAFFLKSNMCVSKSLFVSSHFVTVVWTRNGHRKQRPSCKGAVGTLQHSGWGRVWMIWGSLAALSLLVLMSRALRGSICSGTCRCSPWARPSSALEGCWMDRQQLLPGQERSAPDAQGC